MSSKDKIEHLERVIAARDEQLTQEMEVSRNFAEMVLRRGEALLAFLAAYGSQDSHTSGLDKAAKLARSTIAGATKLPAPDEEIGGSVATEIQRLRRENERFRKVLEVIAGSSSDRLQAMQATAALDNIGPPLSSCVG